ncbi:MAG: T9SS type A sorting domain-containing protein [Bacteroidetes bacterium]|nr:T9SS type A sorting domain-containing protein [Bacteroidota bacterium]
MKKLLLSVIMLLAITAGIGQTVQRQMVVMEITTSIQCTYCPGASMGADDLLAHGDLVAVMEDHNLGQGSDQYANSYSIARCNYYNYTGNPTAIFDGILRYVGGSHTASMYNYYLPRYNQRIAIPANLTLGMTVTNSGLHYTANITMTKVGTLTTDPKHLEFAVTQSHIQWNWEGQTHLEYVNRLMVPNENGTVVDFTSGDTQTVTLEFDMDAAWPIEDCEFIAFVQDWTTKECLNGFKRGVIDLSADFAGDNTQIAKGGTVNFTSTVSGGYMNVPETYQWNFPGGTPDNSTTANSTVTYNECGAHDVTFIVNRGGQIDTILKTAYILVGTQVNVNVTPNDTACLDQSITLDATTPNATYLWAPGGETTPSITINGSTAGAGSHAYMVTVNTPDGCVQQKLLYIFFEDCTGIPTASNASVSIFPNPNNGTFTLNMNNIKNSVVNVKITNTTGATVYEENGVRVNGSLVKDFRLNNLNSGMYFLTIQDGNNKVVQKFSIN